MALPAIIVSGFGRCGSSLTMQMLAAGGVPCVGEWPAYEDQRSSPLNLDIEWLGALNDCAVKLLDPHVAPRLPKIAAVIWLDRDPAQQAASALKFMAAMCSGIDQGRQARRAMAASYRADRAAAHAALGIGATPPAVDALKITFEFMIARPMEAASAITRFVERLGYQVDIDAMASVVVRRTTRCLPYMLEEQLLRSRANAQMKVVR